MPDESDVASPGQAEVDVEPEFLCPACGYELAEPAWADGEGSQEICTCCGLQFGYYDAIGGREDLREGFYVGWRVRWIVEGYPWWSSPTMKPPPDGSPKEQLARIGWPGGTT